MESSDDCDDSVENGPEYSAIIQPPLIKQLKKILDEYPDDGQILKEIIQNAEDAEASQMQILYDERCVNPDDGTKGKPFRKYFKGPALCVYNNAQFKEEDWTGMQMINSSVKEFDPVKIGRFGLGFKSVFHITDFPMIISGNQMLVLDPHQKRGDRVCIKMKLNKMDTYEKHLDVSHCLNALEGLFGFSKETLTSGEFNGTLFRFPLRDRKTTLSDNVYDRKMILDLFNAFKAEASVELIFLKCLERIDLYISDVNEINFSVEISDSCLNEVREKRSKFHSYMKSVGLKSNASGGLKPAPETFMESFNMVIISQDKDRIRTENSWFVLHCLKGGEMSRDLETLCQDDSLSYSPHVSIAVPAESDTEFKGHVFCLLPLPLEEKSMTGFPVHVNGYFALSQNRRHVKWPTADQERNKAHTDKSIKWNKCLVVEVLAEVYFNVLQKLVQLHKENSTWDIMDIYRAIPDHRKITSHWDLISDPLFVLLLNFPILYTENNGGKWIRPEHAVFNIFEGHVTSEVKDTILELMKQLNIDMVCVPDHVTSVIKARKIKIQTLTLDFITRCLQENDSYRKLPFEKKLYLLTYLMSDGNYSKRLKGLELLPLKNGTFSIFGDRNHDKKVIVCQEEVDIFPGQEDIFVSRDIQDSIYDCLFQLAMNSLYQLFVLDDLADNEIAYLLNKVIQTYIGTTAERVLLWNQSSGMVTGIKWLEQVWNFLQKYNLDSFSHLHIIPGINQLYKVSTLFLLRSSIGCSDIPSSVCKCLEYLDIVVLESLPTDILSHKNIKNFVGLPTTENVFRMLEKVQTGGYAAQMIQKFNLSVSGEERLQFVDYISGQTKLNANLVNLFSMMNLFVEKNSRRNVCVNQVRIIAETDDFPVRYFKESIDCTDIQFRNMALLLHVKVIKKEEVILEILECMRSGTQYNLLDQMNMMAFVLKNLSFFRLKNQMVDIAKDIRFIYNENKQVKKASELFDPNDESLRLIVLDRNQFPSVQDLPVDVKMLRKLGLKTICNVTALDVLHCAKYIQNNSYSLTESIMSAKLLEVLQGNTGLLYSDVEGYQLFQHLYNINFMTPSQRPSDFPDILPWYTESSSYCRPSDLVNPKYRKLIGSVKPIFQSTMSLELTKCFNWDKTPDIQDVIKQLLIITEKYEENFKPDLLSIIDDIYRFLAERCDDISSFQNLQNQKWILTEDGFKMPDKVYLHSSQSDISLKPYLFRLSPEFQKQQLLEMFRKMNCADCQDAKLLIKVQEMVREEYINSGKTETIARADLQLVINILNILKRIPNDNNVVSGVLFPVKQPDNSRVKLMPAKKCIYSKDGDDRNEDGLFFVHQDISPEIALPLGVNTKSKLKVKECSRPIDIYSKNFGQHEELITRINRILSGYPCDSGILKELLQNADDAKATEMHIVLDMATYSKENLFAETWKPLQGPALLVYNNSCFSEADLRGIQSLGIGSKGDDPTKTGQYGVGFNAVYQLTDVPSFLTRGPSIETGETLCVMDPQCLFVPDATPQCPGRQYIDTKILKEDYPNVFTCYHENLLMVEKGTIFRFPLRTDQFKSKLSGNKFTESSIKTLLSEFQREMREMLLFVNNVNTIKVSEIVDGCLKENYSVNVDMSVADNTKRQQFYNAIDNAARKIRESLTPDCIHATEIQYIVKVRDSVGDCSQYLIVNRIGFEEEKKLPDQISYEYKKGNLGLLPRGGVALRIDNYRNGKEKEAPGRVFCFLPLPLETGLPLHINGHFALDHETRRNLWTDDKEGYRSAWNTHLMEAVIVPCYVSALNQMKEILCFDVENTTNAVIVREKLTNFHRYFPDTAKVGVSFRVVAFSFYQSIYNNEDELFPCCRLVTNSDVKLKFYPIVSRKFKFPCVFNTLTKTFYAQFSTVSNVGERIHERIEHLSQSTKLEDINKTMAKLFHICKELGIKLLESPKRIMKSMRKSSLAVEEFTPEFFISFLKTYDSDHSDKCQIGQLEDKLDHSTFRTVKTLQICIEYCKMSPTFEEQIEGLPLCLTNDGVLRPFNTNKLVFCTPYFELLKESSEQFLHESIRSLFSSGKVRFRTFDINAFAEFLPYTLNIEQYRTMNRNVNWNPDGEAMPNMLWVEKVWTFLSSVVRKAQSVMSPESSTENVNTVQDFIVGKLSPLLPWCLIPCIQMSVITVNGDNSYEHILVPIYRAQFVVDIRSFSGPMETAILRLNLPLLDKDMYLCYENILEDLVVKRNNPIGLLNILHDQRETIYSKNIDKDDCIEIMHFFCDHLSSLEKRKNADTFPKLKDIPFHVTVSGQNVSIPEGQSVLIMDSIAEADGLYEWAMASSTLLIQTTQKLNLLYQKLGYTDGNLDEIDLYIKHLLPKFSCLPRQHHLVHLLYIKDILLAKPIDKDFNVKQKDLITVLHGVAFIPDCDGNLHSASFFKDPYNELMKLMLPNSMFPTGVYGKCEWCSFLKIAGMQTNITTDMILQFARDIELVGRNGITDQNRQELEDKCKMLLGHVFHRQNIDENLFFVLKQIKFIPPYRVEKWKQMIFSQPNTEVLVCFNESTTTCKQDLCWTRCPIIPSWAEPTYWMESIYDTEIRQKLYSLFKLEEPTFQNVVYHVQNICDALKLLFVAADANAITPKVKKLMSKIYEFLVSKQNEQNNKILKEMLSKKPIVFLPDQMLFVACERVVKSAKPEEVIHPYLVEAPVSYSEFYELFELLGMEKYVNVQSFILVLKYIYNDTCNDELHVNELQAVQRTMQNMFKYLQSSTSESDNVKLLEVENLYLPTRDNILKDAKCLVLSDNDAFEKAIGNDMGMPYVVNLEQFGISITGSFVRELSKLPQHLQPHILSAMVNTRLPGNLTHMPLDENGEQFSSFLTSPQFHRAILRIAVHSRKKYNYQSNFTEDEVNGWIENIQNIQVIQVESLVLNYLFNERIVGKKKRSCYFQKSEAQDERNILYCAFQTTEINEWLVENSGTIDYAILHCTNGFFLDTGSLLLKVLLLINDTERISLLLDREDIEQFSISYPSQASIFPTLGTAVNPDWHRFLYKSFTTFEEGEYVALMLPENNGGKYNRSPYIIARIYRRCETGANADFISNTRQIYEVNVGNGRIERRPAYDLYKFNRSFLQKSTESSPFIDNSTVHDTQLDSTLSEIKDIIRAVWTLTEDERMKIIERLYKEWHPDENHGKAVAVEVFKFIKQTVLDLEQGGNMSNSVHDFNTLAGNSEYRSHFQAWDKDVENDRNHQSNTCEHGRVPQYEPVPSYAEANQWMHQAKRDIAAASQFLEEANKGHHFNWICFICQQCVVKTLKAMHYQIDSNKIPKSNNLQHLAVHPLDDELRAMVTELVGIVGKQEKMMYPDRYKLPKIPADEYERHHADKALEITNQILIYASDRL